MNWKKDALKGIINDRLYPISRHVQNNYECDVKECYNKKDDVDEIYVYCRYFISVPLTVHSTQRW